MTKTYEVKEFEGEEVLEETTTASTKRTYSKQYLTDEIARLQLILNEFPK